MCNCGNQCTCSGTSDNITYDGNYLPTLNVMPNEDLTSIIIKINGFLSSFNPSLSSSIKGGTNTQTASPGQSTFIIPHTLGTLPSTISVTPVNSVASSDYSVTFNSTNIVITYNISLSSGSQPSWVWQAIKL